MFGLDNISQWEMVSVVICTLCTCSFTSQLLMFYPAGFFKKNLGTSFTPGARLRKWVFKTQRFNLNSGVSKSGKSRVFSVSKHVKSWFNER